MVLICSIFIVNDLIYSCRHFYEWNLAFINASCQVDTHWHSFLFFSRPHTLNSTSVSKAYQSTFTGELNTPYSKQFVHSKSSQYRRLKTEWKNNVYLARSRIQGLGLYAAKDLEKHTMVIEYIGTVIRNEVANRREKIYESQVQQLNTGTWMESQQKVFLWL